MFTGKDLRKLIIPLVIEQILSVTVGLVDSMMVSSVGEAAVSGVSLVDTVNILLIGLFGALATGGAVVSAQYLGQKDSKSACSAGEQLIASVFVVALLLMSVAMLFQKDILNLLYGEVEKDVMTNARIYLFYSAMSYPFIAVYNSGAALFRTMGNSKVSMWTSLISNFINIIANAIFIFGLGFGVEGAALATLISRIFAAAALYILLKNQERVIHLGRMLSYRPNLTMIRRILRIGIPNGLENSVFQIGKIIVQGMVAGLGTTAITANAIAGTIGTLGIIPGASIGLAIITVIGQCMGARDYDGIKRYTVKLMKLAYLSVGLINVLLIIILPLLLNLYQLSPETSKLASQLIIYHCILSSIIWPASWALPNALRATNDVKYTMCISMISMWLWRIGLSYVLAILTGMGVIGIWIAMTVDWSFRAVFFIIRFRKEKYRKLTMI